MGALHDLQSVDIAQLMLGAAAHAGRIRRELAALKVR